MGYLQNEKLLNTIRLVYLGSSSMWVVFTP